VYRLRLPRRAPRSVPHESTVTPQKQQPHLSPSVNTSRLPGTYLSEEQSGLLPNRQK